MRNYGLCAREIDCIFGFQNKITFGMNMRRYLTQFLQIVQLLIGNLMWLTDFENLLQ